VQLFVIIFAFICERVISDVVNIPLHAVGWHALVACSDVPY
jgi:hypothetical protein